MARPRYTLKVLADFSSAHTLQGYPGACSRMHGHNWKLEVEVASDRLDDIGMVLDFKAIRGHARDVVEELDHRYLNDIPPFDHINPTAENIAAEVYRRLRERLDGNGVALCAVTLWETERACVRYSEDMQT